MVTAVHDGPNERRIQPGESSPLLGNHGQQNYEDGNPAGTDQAEAVVDVKPGMADKMHLFICSAGIGVSSSIVTTRSKVNWGTRLTYATRIDLLDEH